MSGKITLYVDVVSPFGYLAYYMLRTSPTFKSTTVTYVPILLGGLHKLCNNTAPLFIKNKDKWINTERDRWATQFNIPVRNGPPAVFPVSTVNAQRILCALETTAPEKMGNAIDVLWPVIWNPDALAGMGVSKAENGEYDVKDVKVLHALLAHENALGKELADKVCEMIGQKDVKDRLGANTQKAFEAGAFGLPWLACENEKGEKEGFWGFDHLGQVCGFLGLDLDADAQRSGRKVKAML